MNGYPDHRQGFDEEDLPLGPATPRGSGAADPAPDELLPPFTPGARPAPPAHPADAGEPEEAGERDPFAAGDDPFAAAADPFAGGGDPFTPAGESDGGEAEPGSEPEEELPWLVTAPEAAGEAGRSPGADGGEPAGSEDQEGEMPAWMGLEEGGDGAAGSEEPLHALIARESGDAHEPQDAPEPHAAHAAHAPAEPTEGAEPAEDAGPGAPALAERFESIARLLRARGVAGVLEGGPRDPLGLLLTGFALGYLQRDEDAQG